MGQRTRKPPQRLGTQVTPGTLNPYKPRWDSGASFTRPGSGWPLIWGSSPLSNTLLRRARLKEAEAVLTPLLLVPSVHLFFCWLVSFFSRLSLGQSLRGSVSCPSVLRVHLSPRICLRGGLLPVPACLLPSSWARGLAGEGGEKRDGGGGGQGSGRHVGIGGGKEERGGGEEAREGRGRHLRSGGGERGAPVPPPPPQRPARRGQGGMGWQGLPVAAPPPPRPRPAGRPTGGGREAPGGRAAACTSRRGGQCRWWSPGAREPLRGANGRGERSGRARSQGSGPGRGRGRRGARR